MSSSLYLNLVQLRLTYRDGRYRRQYTCRLPRQEEAVRRVATGNSLGGSDPSAEGLGLLLLGAPYAFRLCELEPLMRPLAPPG